MIIIPAIDLKDRRVVRLFQGDFNKETIYSDEPVKVAQGLKDKGAKCLHIVDLDGALLGSPKNLDIIEQIVKAVDIPIEVGGGLRTEEDVADLIAIGVSRVIIGTRAYEDEDFIKKLIADYGDKIAVSIDVSGKEVVSSGWVKKSAVKSDEFARKMAEIGCKTLIYTNVKKDGTLEGIDKESVKEELAALSGADTKVIIAGGVGSIDDIKTLKEIGSENLYGVITGKAIYEGKIDIAEANKIAEA
ncbi:MAG: 1-(5-phosphoribosyl)-5-[(5-phosphoribosylamino)methylideneamino]imidazole-4-carboxamide isomerase [Candidatus Omnitrophota bacterium]